MHSGKVAEWERRFHNSKWPSVDVTQLKPDRQYWILPNHKIYEVKWHERDLEDLGIDFDEFIEAGAIRFGSMVNTIYAYTMQPSEMLNKAIFYVGSEFNNDRLDIAIVWSVGHTKTTWKEFKRNNFKINMRNPALRRQFSGGEVGQVLFDVNKEWLHPKLRNDLERALGLGIEKMIACGAYGCVYETSDPKMVMKISTDVNEGPAAWAIVSNRFVHPGIVHIYTVFTIERVDEYAYCLVMEKLTSVLRIRSIYNAIQKTDWVEEDDKGYTVPFNSWRKKAMELVDERDWSEHGQEELIRELEMLYRNYAGYPEIEPLLCGICSLANMYDVLIADVHAGNFGLRDSDDVVRWSTGIKAKPLVLLDVGWASYPEKYMEVPGKTLGRKNPPILRPDLLRSIPHITDFL